eukprot:TRINITY_DN62193_c0_g1_i1.p1 TRINITY_DN62193_c0_g1~~TRINITY_DN62193_c0_g1_i1.p1  ORF type:complete len:110 (+),score=13.83 TRINITY_DN62193_c0_g1_i1:170-499(+)
MLAAGLARWVDGARQGVVDTGVWDVMVSIHGDERVVVTHSRTEQDMNYERRFRVDWSMAFTLERGKLTAASGTVAGVQFSDKASDEFRSQLLDVLWERFRARERLASPR